jgi:uncharacterized membrane protein YhhN
LYARPAAAQKAASQTIPRCDEAGMLVEVRRGARYDETRFSQRRRQLGFIGRLLFKLPRALLIPSASPLRRPMDHILHHHPGLVPIIVTIVIAIGCAAAGTIAATVRGWRRGVYVLKPLTTLLIILLAMHLPPTLPIYRTLVIAGLLFSLAGDVFLMLPRDRFVAGLVAFLVAHLLYIGAFTDGASRFGITVWVLAPFLVCAVVLMRILLPYVPRELKVAVIVYAAALLVMAWQGAERCAAGVPGGSLAAAGGVLFVISDAALALDRFRRPFRGAHPLVLATYFAAQTLIALSIS